MASMIFLTCVLFGAVSVVMGHGRLAEPPSRVSAWRYGFDTPINYDDDQYYCGGWGIHYGTNKGKCGICGDPWNANPRSSEPGGKYATGVITRNYKQGQVIDIKVLLTAVHKGWMEFRLCPNNDVTKAASQACLDQNVLYLPSEGGTRVKVGPKGWYEVKAQLPAGMTCSQCVLQWKYNTGNSWGTDPATGKGCMGCGNQEQFRACADVSIA